MAPLIASDYDQSKYLKAADLPHERKFRIKHTTEEQIGLGPDKERRLVTWFTNDPRGLVLNRTNNRTIRGAYGDNTDGWVGKIVVVFPTMADYRGKLVPALRVRIPPPKQTTTAPQQPATSGNGANAPTGNGAAGPAAAPVAAAPPLAVAAAAPLAAAAAVAPLAVAALAAADPELEPDPVKSIHDDLEDEIPF